jgi:ketosteroid isomerase-like protein
MSGCAAGVSGELSPEDLEDMKVAARAYGEAWLTNDPEAVMGTFVADPVLSPSGLPYLEGELAARGFWWPPDSPPATVTRFDFQELEASGSGDIGFVRGTYALVFEYEGATYTNLGKSLHILRRLPDEGWRISHHFWNDLPAGEEP